MDSTSIGVERIAVMRIAVSAAVGFCATAAAYALFRVLQAWFYPPVDPATLITVVKIPFYYRAQLAAYAGLLAALGAHALHERWPERVERALVPIVTMSALSVLVQGVLVP